MPNDIINGQSIPRPIMQNGVSLVKGINPSNLKQFQETKEIILTEDEQFFANECDQLFDLRP